MDIPLGMHNQSVGMFKSPNQLTDNATNERTVGIHTAVVIANIRILYALATTCNTDIHGGGQTRLSGQKVTLKMFKSRLLVRQHYQPQD